MSRPNGFTLIELLLAISISAIVALGTLTLFNSVINIRNALQTQSESSTQIARTLRKLEQDFIQLSPYRAVRDPFGDYSATLAMNYEGLFLTRNGWANSVFMNYERSTLQRVQYRLAEPGSELCEWLETDEENDRGGCLIRSYTAHLDDDGTLIWQHQNLIRPVQTIDWQFLIFDPATSTSDYFAEPPQEDVRTGEQLTRLLGVLVELEMGTGETYQRLFRTPSQPLTLENEAGS